jgi:type II secretory pathway pseudopilin PulG
MGEKIKRGQVWIETVVYTLIGLILIAIVLAYVAPKINESKDAVLIEQSIGSMQLFGEKIDETLAGGIGTRSIISLTIKKGELSIPLSELKNNTLVMKLTGLKKLYSENGLEISLDRVSVISKEIAKSNEVSILLKASCPVYFCKSDSDSGCSVTPIILSASSTPYKLSVEKALANDSLPQAGIRINIREAS